jgi:hypothetical protein
LLGEGWAEALLGRGKSSQEQKALSSEEHAMRGKQGYLAETSDCKPWETHRAKTESILENEGL